MFLGHYEHTIDEKSRLTIPARFREQLGEEAYLTLGFDKNLLLLPKEAFDRMSERVRQMSVTNSDARLLRRLMFANAELVQLDRSGRIIVPQFLRSQAGIGSQVVLVGAGDFVEVWDPETWRTQNERLQETQVNEQRFDGLNLTF